VATELTESGKIKPEKIAGRRSSGWKTNDVAGLVAATTESAHGK
jgi:hypothetical protein